MNLEINTLLLLCCTVAVLVSLATLLYVHRMIATGRLHGRDGINGNQGPMGPKGDRGEPGPCLCENRHINYRTDNTIRGDSPIFGAKGEQGAAESHLSSVPNPEMQIHNAASIGDNPCPSKNQK